MLVVRTAGADIVKQVSLSLFLSLTSDTRACTAQAQTLRTGPRTSTAACPIAALSSTGPACRGTSRGRSGRRGSCGAWKRCRRLVFNECSSCTGRLGMGELLVCERPVDGFSWSPPGRALQADTMRKLVVLEDVVLKSAFPELLPAGASAGPPPLDWWPTQTNRQGDGGALGPHAVERGGIQIERRRGALADEGVHGKHFNGEKHLLWVKRLKKPFFMIQTATSLFFLETNLSLTFQGDFCVSMIGRGAALSAAKTRSQEMCCTSSSKEHLREKDIEHAAPGCPNRNNTAQNRKN